jgi:hypothetical protein
MENFDFKKYLSEGKLLKEEQQNVTSTNPQENFNEETLTEFGGPDKYLGKYKGVNMYKNDEGDIYIKGPQTKYNVVAIEDAQGNKRTDDEIRADVRQAQSQQSYKDYKMSMRYGR